MDIASKTKLIKEDVTRLDAEINNAKSRIQELKSLVDQKKTKEEKLAELKREEAELLALLG